MGHKGKHCSDPLGKRIKVEECTRSPASEPVIFYVTQGRLLLAKRSFCLMPFHFTNGKDQEIVPSLWPSYYPQIILRTDSTDLLTLATQSAAVGQLHGCHLEAC